MSGPSYPATKAMLERGRLFPNSGAPRLEKRRRLALQGAKSSTSFGTCPPPIATRHPDSWVVSWLRSADRLGSSYVSRSAQSSSAKFK